MNYTYKEEKSIYNIYYKGYKKVFSIPKKNLHPHKRLYIITTLCRLYNNTKYSELSIQLTKTLYNYVRQKSHRL